MSDNQTVGRPWPKPMPPTTMRRLGEIGEALTASLVEVSLLDPGDYVYPSSCGDCGCRLEAGHCYCCHPVWGYGQGRSAKHVKEEP